MYHEDDNVSRETTSGDEDEFDEDSLAFFLILIVIGGLICFVFMGRDVLLWAIGDKTTAKLEAVLDGETRSAIYRFDYDGQVYFTKPYASVNYAPPTVQVRYLSFDPDINKLAESVFNVPPPPGKKIRP